MQRSPTVANEPPQRRSFFQLFRRKSRGTINTRPRPQTTNQRQPENCAGYIRTTLRNLYEYAVAVCRQAMLCVCPADDEQPQTRVHYPAQPEELVSISIRKNQISLLQELSIPSVAENLPDENIPVALKDNGVLQKSSTDESREQTELENVADAVQPIMGAETSLNETHLSANSTARCTSESTNDSKVLLTVDVNFPTSSSCAMQQSSTSWQLVEDQHPSLLPNILLELIDTLYEPYEEKTEALDKSMPSVQTHIKIIDQLRCHKCSNYLSCAPLRVLANSYIICGRCSPSESEGPIYRDVEAESILKKVQFPCCFMKHGCTFSALFNLIEQHEVLCPHRTHRCPVHLYSSSSCTWEGSKADIKNHLADAHGDLVEMHQIQRSVVFGEDKQTNSVRFDARKRQLLIAGMFQVESMFEKEIYYDAEKQKFYCIVEYHPKRNGEVCFWRLKIYDTAESDCFISLKEISFQVNGDAGKTAIQRTELNMEPLLRSLENPDCIEISMEFRFGLQ